MLELIAVFLILLGVISLLANTVSGFIYALLIISILVMLIGIIKGKPTSNLTDKTS